MKSQVALRGPKSTIQQKAIQKYPYTLNNQTYFASECYYQNTIINGISLSLKQAKGISNEEFTIGYLNYSNRLIFYVGSNIIIYNSYKRNYEIISESKNLLCLKALSLSTTEKEYVIWIEKKERDSHQLINQNESIKYYYCICAYDLQQKQKIYCENFHTIKHELKPENIQIVAFMHPVKLLGFIINDPQSEESQFVYKKMAKPNEETVFGQEFRIHKSFHFKFLQYDLQSNSYFFVRSEKQIGALRCLIDTENEDNFHSKPFIPQSVEIEKLINLDEKKLGPRKIVHFALSQTYLLILTAHQDGNERNFQFYSLFSYDLIFSQTVWKSGEQHHVFRHNKKPQDQIQDSLIENNPIDFIEFNKNVIIGLKGNSTEISIYSIYEQNLRHIRDTVLEFEYCYKILRLFINPFSSQVMVLSRHYELQGTLATSHKSTRLIRKAQARYKKFYLEIYTFFITMEASVVNVQSMSLRSKNYNNILITPWNSQFLIQCQNSLRCRRWQQKFDAAIKCSAIHPTGQYIALGFNDCFKIYFLTYEGIAPSYVSQNVKQCTSLCYSKTGNDLAASTSYIIFIYDCYSYIKKHQICLGMSYRIEEISYIEGFQNNKVKHCLQCVTNNKRLVIYNVDLDYREEFAFNPKSHIENNIVEGILSVVTSRMSKIKDGSGDGDIQKQARLIQVSNMSNNKKFGAIVYDEKTKVVIFSFGSKIYFISTENFQSLGSFDFQEVSCIQLCRSIGTMFLGTVSGRIIAFPWPNKPINITSKIPIFEGHKSRIKKIKLSSNMFELISISDETKYINSLILVQEMRKIQKYDLQRQFNPKVPLAMDFYLKKGICLYTCQQFEKKCETVKQNEEQAVNFNFILPEQREKQKVTMMSTIQSERQKIILESQQQVMPMKMQALNIKDRVKAVERSLKEGTHIFNNIMQKQTATYQKKLSQLNEQKDQLKNQYDTLAKRLQKEMEQTKQQFRAEKIKAQTLYNVKLNEVSRRTNQAQFEKHRAVNSFLELSQMDEEKDIYSQNVAKVIQQEISILLQRNGYLMSRNSNLEKDIATKKRKIDDIKDLIQTTQRNIDNLPKKPKFLMKPQDIKEQQQINKQFAQTQRKYLKETKKLIQKNKAINVSISLYEKQREMLIILEKQLEKEQKNIDDIIDYIVEQRQLKSKINERVNIVRQKAQKIFKLHEQMNLRRIKARNDFKNYLNKLSLYHQGLISIEKLKKFSKIDPQDMINSPENMQTSIEQKKRKIQKILNTEEKVMNVMRNQRKIYSNEKKKSCMHNQDLLVNFNFLLHENKYLANVIKSQSDKKRNFIKISNLKKDTSRQNTKPTPFEDYVKFKTTRRMKTTPCAQFDL